MDGVQLIDDVIGEEFYEESRLNEYTDFYEYSCVIKIMAFASIWK